MHLMYVLEIYQKKIGIPPTTLQPKIKRRHCGLTTLKRWMNLVRHICLPQCLHLRKSQRSKNVLGQPYQSSRKKQLELERNPAIQLCMWPQKREEFAKYQFIYYKLNYSWSEIMISKTNRTEHHCILPQRMDFSIKFPRNF